MGIDKKKVENIKGIKIIKGDFLDKSVKEEAIKYFGSKIDVILSDMASNTSGNKSLDSLRTNQLCLNILEFAKEVLNKNGVVIAKIFMGEDFNEIKINARKNFKKMDFFKPKSSRQESREIYIHCQGLST